ncbi:MAG: hypothetical protein ABSA02_14045 [Trebonia sp.]|jgi:hypothetical protein
MADETDEIVGSVGRDLVSHLAPEELPLYPSLLRQFQGVKGGRGRKGSSDDQLLGFGAAEVVTMITPVILSFSRGFWEALIAEAAEDSVHRVVEYVKARLPGHQAGQGPPPLSPDQLQLVRTIAEREARRLDISKQQAGLLADAMVGVLTGPAVP